MLIYMFPDGNFTCIEKGAYVPFLLALKGDIGPYMCASGQAVSQAMRMCVGAINTTCVTNSGGCVGADPEET